jgi:Family of unknown function (DUF5330)
MWFLLRIAFWFTVILIVLPSGGTQSSPKAQVSATEGIAAAKAAVDDMRHFCERQPESCSFGSQAIATIGHRAQAGAKMLYEFLTEQFGPNETGSIKGAGSGTASQNTLNPADLVPAWRGPQPTRRVG